MAEEAGILAEAAGISAAAAISRAAITRAAITRAAASEAATGAITADMAVDGVAHGGWGGYGWGFGAGLGLGLYFSSLPFYYSTYWWGGIPYYYADDTFYTWDGSAGEYQTVSPPPEVEQQRNRRAVVNSLPIPRMGSPISSRPRTNRNAVSGRRRSQATTRRRRRRAPSPISGIISARKLRASRAAVTASSSRRSVRT